MLTIDLVENVFEEIESSYEVVDLEPIINITNDFTFVSLRVKPKDGYLGQPNRNT